MQERTWPDFANGRVQEQLPAARLNARVGAQTAVNDARHRPFPTATRPLDNPPPFAID